MTTSRVPARYLSPLRYPGGKGRLSGYVARVICAERRPIERYVEPFAGGAGAGLRLLVDEYVDEIVINDLNPGIAAFWRALFGSPDALLEKLAACEVTIAEWHRQREAYLAERVDDVALGFAFFFLNRTNRSGIPDARPIGGYAQTGTWKIDARFNKKGLGRRIAALSRYGSRVTVCEVDGGRLIEDLQKEPGTFIYADPPYLDKGDDLYLDTMSWEDHQRLARSLTAGGRWLLTYDADPRVRRRLYPGYRCAEFSLTHSAAIAHQGREYAIFSPSLQISTLRGLGERASFLPGG
jgi:DNA adenine methylase